MIVAEDMANRIEEEFLERNIDARFVSGRDDQSKDTTISAALTNAKSVKSIVLPANGTPMATIGGGLVSASAGRAGRPDGIRLVLLLFDAKSLTWAPLLDC